MLFVYDQVLAGTRSVCFSSVKMVNTEYTGKHFRNLYRTVQQVNLVALHYETLILFSNPRLCFIYHYHLSKQFSVVRKFYITSTGNIHIEITKIFEKIFNSNQVV